MDDHKLDEFLKTGKAQAERFFAGWQPGLQPQQVQARQPTGKIPRFWSRCRLWQPGLVAAGVLLLVLVSFNLRDTAVPSPPVNTPVVPHGLNGFNYGDYNPVINMLLAEDFVFQGHLMYRDGILVEEGPGGLVTRIIPYQIDPYGDLVLSADRVMLQVGEELLLIGVNLPQQVELSSGDYFIKKVNEGGSGDLAATRFSVHRPGEELLELIPKSDPAKKRIIYVQVVH